MFRQTVFVAFVASIIAFAYVQPVAAATYNVTSTECSGPGSLDDAIQQANTNPGADTIHIAPKLVISGGCPSPALDDDSSLQITESLTIQGNSALFHGINLYISNTGKLNVFETGYVCPGHEHSGYRIGGISHSLFMIGQRNVDNTGVEVTIEDFGVDSVSQLAQVLNGAKLTMRNVSANEIEDIQYCARGAIDVFGDGELVLDNVDMYRITNFSHTLPTGMIVGDTGKLEIYNSQFRRANGRYAVEWGGDVDIVSSRFAAAGGLFVAGGTMQVVNSLFLPAAGATHLRSTDGFLVIGGGSMVFEASTIVYNVNECPPSPSLVCVWDGAVPSTATLQARNGFIRFEESALHVQTLDPALSPSATLLLEKTSHGLFFADVNTFIQPLDWQNAAALEDITLQPALLTGADALPVSSTTLGSLLFNYPDSVTPIITGDAILVDKIPDAGIGEANELQDPRGNTIMRDILGNPRIDIGGTRSIGAVQNNVVSHLVAKIDPVDPNTADLSWSYPISPGITAYDVCHGTGVAPDPVAIGTACPDTLLTDFTTCPSCLTGVVAGLPDAVQVWFLVRATATGTPEPWSAPASVATPVTLTYPATAISVGLPVDIQPVLNGTLVNPDFTISAGQLPPGLTLDPGTGIITGTPTYGGPWPMFISILVTGGTGPANIPNSSLGELELSLSGGCQSYVTHANGTISGPTTLVACISLSLVSDVTVEGDVTFRAGSMISLGTNVSIVEGANVSFDIDPALLP